MQLKYLFALFLITMLISPVIHCQTLEKENQALSLLLSEEVLSSYEFSKIAKKWVEYIDEHPYPILPVDSSGLVEYSYILEFANMSREKLFHRTLEWLTIRYGILPTYLYSNAESGKIICPNSLKIIGNTSGVYTFIFTIKDNRIMLEFANMGWEVTTGGYYAGETWLPEKSSYMPIQNIFPIAIKDNSEWEYYLKIITTINNHAEQEKNSLINYIDSYELQYNF